MEDGTSREAADLERKLTAQIDMSIRLASLSIESGSVERAKHSLSLFEVFRADAARLAALGKPEVSARLDAIVADLGRAIVTMGGTVKIIHDAQMADFKHRATNPPSGPMQGALKASTDSANTRAAEIRKLL